MKYVLVGLLASSFFCTCYAEPSTQAAYMNTKIKEGKCSTKNNNWCPVDVADSNTGFILHSASESVVNLSLNYKELAVPCLLWTTAGGKEDAIAQLLVVDKAGIFLVLSRRCK